MMFKIDLYNGDCLEEMDKLIAKGIGNMKKINLQAFSMQKDNLY